jgi:hypothetical protein
MAAELLLFNDNGVMRHRFNGSGHREKLSAQRKVWNMRKTANRNNQITGWEALRAEREDGNTEHKQSIARQKILEGEIKALQEALKLDKRRTDVKLDINALRKDVEEEKNGRREWVTRRADIDIQLEELRSGPLAGTRLNGRRPAERPTGDPERSGEPTADTSLRNEVVGVGPGTGLLTFFLGTRAKRLMGYLRPH